MISIDLAPYRGSVRFAEWGWSTLVDRIINYSHTDYQITDRMANLAVQFYRNIDADTIVLDRECGGKVLKERFIQKAEKLVGMTRDNPTFQRSLLKVPYAVSCPNLWSVLDEDHPGLFLPLRRVIACRKFDFKHLQWASVSSFGFHKYDGDMWIDLENRIIHWECMPALYPYHQDLIGYATKQIDRHFFSENNGGVIVTPSETKLYGDGKEVLYSDLRSIGYTMSWGANALSYLRKPERVLTIVGEACPHCDSGSLFKSRLEWRCANRCGYSIPRVSENIEVSERYALNKLLHSA
jgi:hypothetical protein